MVSSSTRQALKAVVHLRGSLPGRSVRPQPSRNSVSPETRLALDEEALAAGRVARRVDELDHELADGDLSPAS